MSWIIAALVVLAGACVLLEVAHRRLVAKVEGLRYEVKCAQLAADTVNTRIHTVNHRLLRIEGVVHEALHRPAPWDEVTTDEPELAETYHRLSGELQAERLSREVQVEPVTVIHATTGAVNDGVEIVERTLIEDTIKTAKKGEPVIW